MRRKLLKLKMCSVMHWTKLKTWRAELSKVVSERRQQIEQT
jgi:hypothetical protein